MILESWEVKKASVLLQKRLSYKIIICIVKHPSWRNLRTSSDFSNRLDLKMRCLIAISEYRNISSDFSQVWRHYLLFPGFSYRRFLVFFLSHWFFTIPCTMCSSAHLDFTCDHVSPIYYNIRTFYSDWWWFKIGSEHFIY